jgi:hypothetical protein
MSIQQAAFWPYVGSGLLVILIFWSRSVLHIITLIRWPLEFGHNFLYIVCVLAEALMFTRLNDPLAWFLFGSLYAAIGWALFTYDLRLLHAREQDSAGVASNLLYALVTRDQFLNIRFLLPAVLFLNIACVLAIRAYPEVFLARHGHVWLGVGQFIAFSFYLIYVVRFYTKLAPAVLRARQEWHGDV